MAATLSLEEKKQAFIRYFAKFALELAIKSNDYLKVKQILNTNHDWMKVPYLDEETLKKIYSDKATRKNMLSLLLKFELPAQVNDSSENILNLFLRCVNEFDEDAAYIADLMLQYGISIEHVDVEGYTPLHRSIRSMNRKLITTLINKGADVHAKTDNDLRCSALHIAAFTGDIVAVKKFVSRGLDVNFRSVAGNTPLHLACLRHHESVIKFLLQNGALLSPEDCNKETPVLLLNPEIVTYKECVVTIVTEMCKFDQLNIPFSKEDKQFILEYGFAKEHFKKCSLEFEKMKNIKLPCSLNFYSIFTDKSHKVNQLSMLVNNKTFVKNYVTQLSDFRIYKTELKKFLKNAIKKNNDLVIVNSRLQDCTFIKCLPVVARMEVLKYLSSKDVPLRRLKRIKKTPYARH